MSRMKRQSNIELLRILAIIGVMLLHYNNPVIGGGIAYVESGSLNFYILYFLESLFVCGVNQFMLISGFFICESKKKSLWRPIELIIQVIIFREVIYLVRVLLGSTLFSVKTMLTTLLPVNYFVILYCVVFILSPYINLMIERLSNKNFKNLIVVLVCLFSIYPTFVDVLGELRGVEFIGLSSVGMYGSQWGYTVVNFILMYIIGAYLKKGNSKIRKWSTGKLIAGLLVCIILMVIWARANDVFGFFTERSAWEYCNPLVIAEAVFVFCLFERIDIGSNKVINKMAEGVFTVFLLHQVFIPHLRIEQFVTGHAFVMVVHIIICLVVIYVICCGVHIIYHLVTDPVFKILSTKIRLPSIDIDG